MNASTEQEIEAAFASFGEHRLKALIVISDAFFMSRRDQLIALSAPRAAYNILVAGASPRRRPDELWDEHYRGLCRRSQRAYPALFRQSSLCSSRNRPRETRAADTMPHVSAQAGPLSMPQQPMSGRRGRTVAQC